MRYLPITTGAVSMMQGGKRVVFSLRQSRGTPHVLTITTLALFGLFIFKNPVSYYCRWWVDLLKRLELF